ncbi:MAG: hypothetical protein R3E35_09255 [Rhodocyclaceae bacterium]
MLPALRLTALLGVLATEAWVLWTPNGWELKWDALAGFFAALLALFLLERKDHQVSPPSSSETERVMPTDIVVFEKVIELLKPNGVISFLREHDFGGSFLREDIAPLHTFVAVGGNPDNEFVNPALEKERQLLLTNASDLAMLIAKYTSPNSVGNLSVLPNHLVNLPRPDWVLREAKELNEAASAFVEIYDNFVRFCRARIAKSAVYPDNPPVRL